MPSATWFLFRKKSTAQLPSPMLGSTVGEVEEKSVFLLTAVVVSRGKIFYPILGSKLVTPSGETRQPELASANLKGQPLTGRTEHCNGMKAHFETGATLLSIHAGELNNARWAD